MSLDKTSADKRFNSESDQWLNSAIDSKLNLMQFVPPSPQDLDPNDSNPTINLSRFGFKNINDLKTFLLSPAGDTFKAELSAKIALDKTFQEQQRLELQEQAKMHSRIKIHLLLWLMEKKGEAAEQLKEIIIEQNEKALKQSSAKPPQKPSDPVKANKELKQALTDYDTRLSESLEKHDQLTEQLTRLKQQKAALESKHEVYRASLDELENAHDQHEELNPDELNDTIKTLEDKIHSQTEQITALLDNNKPGNEEEAHTLLNKQNALNLQLASLYDLRSKQQGEKVFFNAEGKPVSSQKDADFVVSNKKKIVEKDGKYYLLNSGDELTAANKDQAALDFNNSKHELMSVKKSVENTIQLEKDFHNFDKRIEEVDAEKLEIENQIKLMQSVRSTLTQPSDSIEQEAPTPRPMPSSSKVASRTVAHAAAPVFVMSFIETQLPSIFNKKRISSKFLFDKVDELVKKPQNAEDIKKLLRKTLDKLGLGTIPSLSPLPHFTMESLIKYMPVFGANPNKFDIPSPMQSPKDTPEAPKLQITTPKLEPEPGPEPERIFNPTPFDNGSGA